MNRLLFLAFLLLLNFLAFSQDKYSPVLKTGNTLNYNVMANGQQLTVSMRLDSISNDYTKMGWALPDGSTGSVINKKQSMDSAVRFFWGELHSGEEYVMPDDQNILVLSKALWNKIKTDKKFTVDDQVFILKDQPAGKEFKLNNKPVDLLYFENAAGTTKMWLLNNPSIPVILKIEGNPAGIDLDLTGIS